jgi:hypothetical protein
VHNYSILRLCEYAVSMLYLGTEDVSLIIQKGNLPSLTMLTHSVYCVCTQQDLDIHGPTSTDDITSARHPTTVFGENSCMNMLSRHLTECKQLKTVEIILCGNDYEDGGKCILSVFTNINLKLNCSTLT